MCTMMVRRSCSFSTSSTMLLTTISCACLSGELATTTRRSPYALVFHRMTKNGAQALKAA